MIISDDSAIPHKYTSEYFLDYNNVIFVKNDGIKGIFPNLNNAIELANGDFIQIFCQDDVMESHFLASQLLLLEKTDDKCGFGFCSYYRLIDGVKDVSETTVNTELFTLSGKEALEGYIERGCMPGNISTIMIKKSAIEVCGGFEESFAYAGDFEFIVRLCIKGYGFAFSSAKNLSVRLHQNRASNTLNIYSLIKELVIVYRTLLAEHETTNYTSKTVLYINQNVGVGLIKRLRGLPLKRLLRSLSQFRYPLNPLISIMMMLWIKLTKRKISISVKSF